MENGIIYARFSSYGQNEQSIEAQVRICKEFAESKDIQIVNVYSDKAKTENNGSPSCISAHDFIKMRQKYTKIYI